MGEHDEQMIACDVRGSVRPDSAGKLIPIVVAQWHLHIGGIDKHTVRRTELSLQ
jgi:hypothetical protein